MPRHVRKGDEVIVTAGNFRGAVGTIVRILTKADRAVVQFAPSVYDGAQRKQRIKALRPNRINPQGGQVALDRSFHLSNLSPVVDGKPSRVRFQTKDSGEKVRVAARGGKELGVIHAARDGAKKARTSKKTTTKKTTKKKAAKASEA
ncbi:MAG: 50S ribosomal protein L24 [Phycisphaerales bacterium]|nr:50S ribosomal protein L24 [Phycisphaerales bacterium]